MGNAVDNSELLLQPYQLLDLMPLLADLYEHGRRNGVLVAPGNNVGYYGPYEHLWRTGSERGHWSGCSAGHTVIGIESDGVVKGCPSLPTVGYAGGNVRDLAMEDLWLAARDRGGLRPRKEMWGFCGDCYYADVCRAGCTWTSHSLLGRSGNNPYCHHRALTLAGRGLRERVMKVEEAADASFAIGRFVVVEEQLDGTPCASESVGDALLVQVVEPTVGAGDPGNHEGSVPTELRPCRGCSCFVKQDETRCPFCAGDLDELERAYEAKRAYRLGLVAQVEAEIAAVRGSAASG
jgi:radical SAM protein with 4Fe4S-binding SPASM domain